MPQRVPRCAQLRNPQLPCGQRVAHAPDLLPEPQLREARRNELSVWQREHLDMQPPALARLEREVVHHPRAVDLAALGEDHLRLQRQLAVVGDEKLVAALVVLDRPAVWKRFRAQWVAQGEVEVLDGEDVREVGAHVELHVELDTLHALVLEHARVLGEQPFHVAVQVSELVADAEGRAFEDAELLIHQLSVRSMRPPDDCASALTTSSSTFTRAGRVTTQTTHSAMSCGCIASTPSYTFRAVSSSPRNRTSEKSVCTRPGSTVQMWIGRPSRSSRSAYVNPRTANLEVT